MEEKNNTDSTEDKKVIFDAFSFIGALQFLPITIFMILSFVGLALFFSNIKDEFTSTIPSRINEKDVLGFLAFIIIFLGTVCGVVSSFIFFKAKNQSFKTLNRGILLNGIAWIILAFTFIVLMNLNI